MKTLLTTLFAFFCCKAISQKDYTIVYNYGHLAEFNSKGKASNAIYMNTAVFILGDTISLYKHRIAVNARKVKEADVDLSKPDMHHGILNPLKENYLLEISAGLGYNSFIKVPHRYVWTLVKDSINILGIKCYKATVDTSLMAWYAPSIPIPTGPNNYVGLPGLVLQVSDYRNNTHIIAKRIDEVVPSITFHLNMKIFSLEEYGVRAREYEAKRIKTSQ